MDKRNFSNLGEDIKNIVQDAVNTRDFHQLNVDIGNTVNSAIDEVRRSIGLGNGSNRCNGGNFGNVGNQRWNRHSHSQPWKTTPNDQRSQAVNTYTNNQNQYNQVRKINRSSVPVGSVSGILLSVFGNIGIGLLGTAVIVLSILGQILGNQEVFGTIVLGLIPLLIGSLFMSVKGGNIRKRLKRFQHYTSLFRGRNYCLIKDLTASTGLNNKFIVKDLQKMITIGMFPEGHIDEQKTCFMLNRDSYEQYLKLQENMRMQRNQDQDKQAQERKQEQEGMKKNALSPEIKASIEEGRSFVRKIREANDAIPGEEVSRKLERLEEVIDKIFNYVEIHPEQLTEIKKFMEYYLPTTLKLLNAYKEFDIQPVQGDNITSAKKEIEKTLDTINMAFENLLDSLFEDAAMDISTDISVLETILAQEGLTKKNFTKN